MFYPEQVIGAAGDDIRDVIVITKGAVRMRFPPGVQGHGAVKPHTVVASVGESQCIFGIDWQLCPGCTIASAIIVRDLNLLFPLVSLPLWLVWRCEG